MPSLRWILIACGLVLLVAIYVWGRRGNKQAVASEEGLVHGRHEPHLPVHDPGPRASLAADYSASVEPVPEYPLASSPTIGSEYEASVRQARRGRVEPTLDGDFGATAELPVDDVSPSDVTEDVEEVPQFTASSSAPARSEAPTLAMSETPQPKRIERRKIVPLRLAAGAQRFDGGQLYEALEAEGMQHGKYDVFHRLHETGEIVFSIASMVEPGTFDLDRMATLHYPGVTLFALLPGPVAGIEALNEMIACGRRLQDGLGGTLQDERGVPLTVHRIERLRQEVREFDGVRDRQPRIQNNQQDGRAVTHAPTQ